LSSRETTPKQVRRAAEESLGLDEGALDSEKYKELVKKFISEV